MKSLVACVQDSLELPIRRPSLFDPLVSAEPWIERCRCSELLALFAANRPIAVIAGSSLDHVALNGLLFQLHQRSPR